MKKKKIITSLSGVAALVAPAAAIATACTEEGKPTPTEIKISAMFESQEINENTPIKVTNNDTVQFSQTGGENPVWQVASNNGVEIDENGKFTVIWVPPEQTTYEITCKCDGNYSDTFHLTLKDKVQAPITSITATYKGESVVENTPITVESWDVIQFNQTGGQNPVWSVSSEADAEIGGDGLLNTKEVPTQETSYLITCACNGGYRKTFNLILKSDEQTPTIEITATYKG